MQLCKRTDTIVSLAVSDQCYTFRSGCPEGDKTIVGSRDVAIFIYMSSLYFLFNLIHKGKLCRKATGALHLVGVAMNIE